MKYSDFLQLEQFSHQKLGGFNPNSLFTRTVESADLLPSNRQPWDAALPVHVHEYIHYLHNISTPSGVVFLFNGFNLFFEFMRGTNKHGIYEPKNHLSENTESILKVYSLLQGGVIGERPSSESKIKLWKFSAPNTQEVPLRLFDYEFDTFSMTRIDVELISYYGSSYEFTLEIGINLITEGIAYEIDREIRRKIGAWDDLDEHTPPYPYLLFQHLIDYLVGRKTSLYERLILGVCALLEIAPGKGLLRACRMLKSFKTTTSEGFCNYILTLKQGLEGFKNDLKNQVMPNMIRNFSGSSSLQGGVEKYLDFVSISFEKRCTSPLMELGFMHITSHETFFRKIASLVPQWICQEKQNNKAEISLIGDPAIVNAVDEVALSILQSAFHYVQLHLKSDGTTRRTSDIPSVKCPFIGACQAQSQVTDSKSCAHAPWSSTFREQEGIKKPTCFYSHGVKSLFYEDHT
ncbi:hypothetical protein FP359_09505 [Klebsiella variicola]|uniref:hypothetical protein n=1 Tax=Klebsiella variicola TaxID=244366 RepID=UPI001C960659|nr:hypothetical protein [Klebsiella variicola]MBY5170093.1 hypothetical protein [Klebsiella variicola]